MKAAALLMLLCSMPAGAQFRSRVDSVTLDVLVVNRGRPVAGLTAEDFEVLDNGVPQDVRLLGRGALPLDVILALDMSGSLTADRLETLRNASLALLDRLRPGDRAGLLTFSHVVRQGQSLTTNVQLVRDALARVEAGGSTSLVDAMFTSLFMADTAGRRTLLIVLSDGVDTGSWLPQEAVIETARRSEVVIYAAWTGGGSRNPQVLSDVTSATGGQVLQAESRRLGQTFVDILDEFRQRYVLSYTLPRAPAPGWHRIDVRVRPRGAQVKTRSGYMVPGR